MGGVLWSGVYTPTYTHMYTHTYIRSVTPSPGPVHWKSIIETSSDADEGDGDTAPLSLILTPSPQAPSAISLLRKKKLAVLASPCTRVSLSFFDFVRAGRGLRASATRGDTSYVL